MMMMMVKTCERRRRWKNQVRWTWKLWERTTYCQWMANQNHLEAIHIFSLPISSHNTSNSHSSQPTSKSTNLIHKPPKLIPTPSKSWSWSWLLILATEAQKTEKQCPPHLISPFPKWYDEKIYTEWVSEWVIRILLLRKRNKREKQNLSCYLGNKLVAGLNLLLLSSSLHQGFSSIGDLSQEKKKINLKMEGDDDDDDDHILQLIFYHIKRIPV